MYLDRRTFLSLTAGGVVARRSRAALAARPMEKSQFKAMAFDAFPIFDPRPIAALTESLFPGQGPAIMDAWRTRQFEYQWLRALSGQYADFLQTTEESLRFVARQMQLEMPAETLQTLMSAYSRLQAWPDAPGALQTLRKAGLRLTVLSNMTQSMLVDGLRRSGLNDLFDDVLSTDAIESYKPDPRAYQLGLNALKLRREEILFVAFAGWDVAGAKWFGYPTFWVNRSGGPMEELGVAPDASGPDLNALVKYVLPNP